MGLREILYEAREELRELRNPLGYVLDHFPRAFGVLREQAMTFGNIPGCAIYDQVSGYDEELETFNSESHFNNPSQDLDRLVAKVNVGIYIGAAFDVATLSCALASPHFISEEFREFSRNFWIAKGITNALALSTYAWLYSRIKRIQEKSPKQAA